MARPSALLNDGGVPAYPVPETMYASPWPSADATSAMGRGLVRGIAARARAASWLLGERLDDWDLALVVSGESHSAAEAFWHGIDPAHPLHGQPSTVAAASSLTEVYRATDRFVADVIDAAAADTVIVFSMGGMGPNQSDVPSMVLLPELLFRWACHETLLDVPADWSTHPRDIPTPAAETSNSSVSDSWYPSTRRIPAAALACLNKLPAPVKRSLQKLRPNASAAPAQLPAGALRLDWQPATRYRPWWPKMPAFAVPSFYDGRVRVNLRGRERDGVVDGADYASVCDSVERLLRECRDPSTGEPVVTTIERASDPYAMTGTDADLVIVWRGGACAFEHPEHGLIGPVPFLRSGGHTGPYGFAYIANGDIPRGEYGVRSAFDVAPSIVEMVGCPPIDHMSGTSLLRDADAVTAS
jgi:predicted AlkP superfamily phosphohydrolase/phosphomutase